MQDPQSFHLASWLIENWEIVFLYGLKYIRDVNKMLIIHETEIKNLKEKHA